ncbi:hypothetical protein [Micromonospora sp. NPDC005806]|uniref:hypothetical protein n=1 Tax=Micromonospora sp. NPDC005806 TaxID=3364234 RepID=UPI0036ADEB77
MKTTTKLWIIGLIAGLLAFGILAFATGYIFAIDPPTSPKYALLAATVVCLGVLAVCSCMSAVIVRALQDDQRAASVLREVEQRIGGLERSDKVLPFRRDI